MLLSRTTRTLFTGVGTGRARDRQCAAGAGAGESGRHRARLRRSSAREFETRTRRQIAEGGVRVPRQQRADRHREGPPHRPRGHDPVRRHLRPQQPGRDSGADRAHADGGRRGRRVRARPAAAARRATPAPCSTTTSRRSIFDNPFRAIDSASASSRGRLTLRADQLVHRRQRPRVGEAAASLARERVRLGRQAHRRRRSDRAADDQFGAAAGAARARDRGRRGADDGGQSHFVSRPTRYVDVTAGYRQYDYDNRTPEFAMTQRVSYDNARLGRRSRRSIPSRSASLAARLDADLKLTPSGGISAGVGFTRLARGADASDLRVDDRQRRPPHVRHRRPPVVHAADEVRARPAPGRRHRGGRAGAGGHRRAARHASLRHRGARPESRDDPRIGDAGANVGVEPARWPPARTTTWRACSACGTTRIASTAPAWIYAPTERVVLGTSYSYERYNALSRSRQANPGVQFTDPSRNWATDATDRAHSWLAERRDRPNRRARSISGSATTSAAPAPATSTSPARWRIEPCPKRWSFPRRCRRRRRCLRR